MTRWNQSVSTCARLGGKTVRGTHLGVVEALNVTEGRDVLGGDKVDRDTLATEATAATDAVDVVLARRRQVVVDDLCACAWWSRE